MRKIFAVSTMITLLVSAAVQAVTIQENTIFPDSGVIQSQLIDDGEALGVRDLEQGSNDIDAVLGQTFTLESSATVRAITLKSYATYGESWFDTGAAILDIWIGEDNGTVSNNVSGATNLLTSVAITNIAITAGNYYTFNLDSDVVLPAGDYSFQFQFQGPGTKNQWFFRRANGSATNNVGGQIWVQTTDGTPVDFPVDDPNLEQGDDLVFGLHSTVIGTVPTLSVDPEEVTMLLDPSQTQATGTVAVAYTAGSTMDIALSISDESHPGSFSVLSATTQTLTTPAPATTALEFEFDNTVSNLEVGATATGLVTIAWTETGSGITNETVLPISASTGFAPDANNSFKKLIGTWGNPANWDLGRVPGSLGADRALIQNALGRVCNVETNFTGLFPYRVWIRTPGGTPNTLNVGADLKGCADISVGQAAGQYGVLNQTAGDVETADLNVGDPGATAPSNSYYNLLDGTLDLNGNATISETGVLNIDGGALNLVGLGKIDGFGSLKLQSGSFTAGDNSSGAQTLKADVEISGGTFSMLSQTVCSDPASITVIGDEASITMRHIQTTDAYGNFGLTLNFDLDETGVSTINMTSWMLLQKTKINVDGSAYTGGSQTILLIDGGSLNGAAASSNITVTGFADAYTAEVTQDGDGNGDVILTITAGVYADWAADYGVGAGDENPDGDTENNFYEYAFGGDPTNGAIKGNVPTSAVVEEGGTNFFEYVYVRRIGAETELDYQPVFGSNLVYTNWSGADVVEIDTGTFDADYESVTNRVDMTGKPVGFMQVVVEQL